MKKSIILLLGIMFCISAVKAQMKIDSTWGRWNGKEFEYKIDFVTAPAFNAATMELKFNLQFFDRDKKIVREVVFGPTLSIYNGFGSDNRTEKGSVPLEVLPAGCVLQVFYKHVPNPGWKPTGKPNEMSRSIANDPPWELVAVDLVQMSK